jgi:hypothetical protein
MWRPFKMTKDRLRDAAIDKGQDCGLNAIREIESLLFLRSGSQGKEPPLTLKRGRDVRCHVGEDP